MNDSCCTTVTLTLHLNAYFQCNSCLSLGCPLNLIKSSEHLENMQFQVHGKFKVILWHSVATRAAWKSTSGCQKHEIEIDQYCHRQLVCPDHQCWWCEGYISVGFKLPSIIHVSSDAHASTLPPPYYIVGTLPNFKPKTPTEWWGQSTSPPTFFNYFFYLSPPLAPTTTTTMTTTTTSSTTTKTTTTMMPK